MLCVLDESIYGAFWIAKHVRLNLWAFCFVVNGKEYVI